MKTIKLFTTAFAAIMTFSSIAVMTSNALAYPASTTDSEFYKSKIEKLNSSEVFTPAPELAEYMDDVLEQYDVKNIWIKNRKDTSQFSEYHVEYAQEDSFSFTLDIPATEADTVVELFKSELGYSDKINITFEINSYANNFIIGGHFLSSDHELNIMITEKAYTILKEKYPIISHRTVFDCRNFTTVLVQSCFTYIDGKSHMDLTEQEFKEFYDSIDHDYIAEEFRAIYNPETRKIEFSEDYTQEEKLECFSYFAKKHNTTIYQYYQLSATEPITADIDFETVEISYLNGDANCDQKYTIADSTAILQALGNPDKYGLSTQGLFNADSTGDGLTVEDAVAIKTALAKGA